MKKRLKEVLAWILSITMLCAICPPMYAAAANGDEIVAYDTEIMVEGNAVSKTGIQLAINKQLEDYSATNPAGAVRLVLNPTDNIVVINNSLSDITYINVPTDKGITSFTITTTKEGATSEDPVKLFVEMGSGANVFANGIPLVVTGPIIVNGDIYGGSDGKDIQKNTSIVYNGATSSMNNRRIGRTSIYGGGLNSTIDGSTYIEIRSSQAAAQSGSGFSVHGGGNVTEKEKTANVTGDTNIDLYAPVFVVNGGGYVSDGGTANVFGDTHINILSGADVYKFAWVGGMQAMVVRKA
ncbi:hypothetical protein NE562_00145 [Butyricicoccus faecihominis]|uniref:hypothetical protein n=1 Tax=Butyricicoccus faecihominis TaxID=1712515 RepID=UPI00247958C1|nr:hypothetical protein [Butyricicoccus faecihominis]MCQ5128051.1 hypothetical protein [Butyricicoccus faecihominis]